VSANDLGTAVLFGGLRRADVTRVAVASSMSIFGEGLYRSADGWSIEDATRTPADLRAGRWEPRSPDGAALVPVPTPESKRPDLASVYALTKYAQERLTLVLAHARTSRRSRSGFSTLSARARRYRTLHRRPCDLREPPAQRPGEPHRHRERRPQ
jgi:nucleoside-diphosphate-sugar epimerase